ncbi:hypothetical protein RRG08_034779 [Elysia crispata]|uniref:Uncharacterized protein n=1 Tax=Elysia crispata TaxID=231223 RepID=A0AAE0YAF5_9GAST|nr:hypothetical protein RRG08_034779 [Elysia crispata]
MSDVTGGHDASRSQLRSLVEVSLDHLTSPKSLREIMARRSRSPLFSNSDILRKSSEICASGRWVPRDLLSTFLLL